jgi:hypothetical protein
MKSGGIEKINKKLVNKDECICAECHKQGKVGGLIFDQLTGDPILFCKDCAAKREEYYKKDNL